MGKQTFQRVKKILTVLLLVSLAVSLTATSVSATASNEKEQTISEPVPCQECSNLGSHYKCLGTCENGMCAGRCICVPSVSSQKYTSSYSSQMKMAKTPEKGNCTESVNKTAKVLGSPCCSQYGPSYFCRGTCEGRYCVAGPSVPGKCESNDHTACCIPGESCVFGECVNGLCVINETPIACTSREKALQISKECIVGNKVSQDCVIEKLALKKCDCPSGFHCTGRCDAKTGKCIGECKPDIIKK
jgi:hypothetical protein